MKKQQTKQIIYNGIVITKLPNGKYRWFNKETTLEQCKKEIDKEYKGESPLGNAFTL